MRNNQELCLMNNFRIEFSLLFILLYCSCTPKANHTPGFKYDLQHPSREFELPRSLKEISGITFYTERKIACIQDEKGKIYLYNLKKEEVKESVNFAADHDYEAIALVNDTFYILHSTGTLFEVTHFDTDSQQTKKYDTFLKKENNTEGLCYDNQDHQLLIACKGVSFKTEKEDQKEIYAFDLATHQLDPKPLYSIHLHELAKFIKANNMEIPAGENKNSFFEPSELAIHPLTKEIYVLSSTGTMIIVLDRSGNINEVAFLDPTLAAHPEGMTFSENGNLFISSEGTGKKKVILEFTSSR